MSSEHTVEDILRVATHKLAEMGMRGFRVREVARGARVSLGTLTYYFPTKERLLESIAYTFMRGAQKNWSDQAKNVDTAGLAPIVAGFYSLCRRHQSIVRLLVQLSARDGHLWGATERIVQLFLDDVEKELGADKRMLAFTVVCAAMTYTLHSDSQLQEITGASSSEEAHQLILEHLQAIAEIF